MKKLMVIQEHHANRAGKHWDLRFEHEPIQLPRLITETELIDIPSDVNAATLEYEQKRNPYKTSEPRNSKDSKVLMSFAIPKARLPEGKEMLLAIKTEDHPWEYKDFEGKISEGYGEGQMELLFSDSVEIIEWELNTNLPSIKFIYKDKKYHLWKATFANNNTNDKGEIITWLIKEGENTWEKWK